MSVNLSVLREQREKDRFARLRDDDSRTAIASVDADALAAELKPRLAGEVRFDKGARALYSTDGSNYRQVPIGVVIPRNLEDVQTTMALARRFGAPILSRGGGTSLAGQCCNVAVVMDFSKYMHRVLEIDVARRLGRVEPGCVLDDLRNAAKKHGLNFAPDPETHSHCTLGGMLGNNSCGVHSLMAKNNGMGLRSSDNTAELEILTYDGARFKVGPTPPDELERIIRAGGRRGEIYAALKALRDKYADQIRSRFPKLDRRVSGYNLDELLPENNFNVARLLVGTESTCVTILQATLHLVPEPKARSLLMLGYPSIYDGAEHLLEILEFKPIGLEGIDHLLFKFVKDKGDENAQLALLPPGQGYLLVEFGGDSKEDSDAQAQRLMERLTKQSNPPHMKLFDDPTQEEMIWKVREGSLGSTAWVPGMPDTWEGWEDSAVPVPNVANYLRDLRKLLDRYDYHPTLYGHLGQGCIHTRIPFDLYTTEGVQIYRHFIEEASDLVLKYGGSFSGEHGDGQSRGELLPKLFGPELTQAFREFKRIWDPQWKMNPGKVIDAYRMDENLRLGPDYNPPQPETYFAYPADRHSFARASLRCVGVGECRREGGGTMCPSYMATREEMHSTRGRARMLFEMMNGEVIDEGWRSEHVKESLDLCLSCKGCKGDCPVNVDMATYKAEFLAHYYEGRLRPRHAYAFGWIHLWARLASHAPMLANFFTQMPGLRGVAKFLAGMTPKRSIPAFAPQTFQSWFRAREPKNPTAPPVVLFPDTFNNHFHPEIAKAAVEVLEDAGFHVTVPMQDICCGRPLYDYGFLNMARRWLLDLIDKLRPSIRDSVPIVVLEPSCWSVFRDELTNILPNDEDAKRLQGLCFTLSDFIDKKAQDYHPPKLHRKMLLHGHCHQKALDRINVQRFGELFYEKDLLKKMELEFDDPPTGCCGMAGAFGFEPADHYAVSIACGEHVLLPKVRDASDETIICANGFSCREQISQCTDRHPLHLAQVMQMAIHSPPTNGRPEAHIVAKRKAEFRRAAARTAAIVAAGVVIGSLLYQSRPRSLYTRIARR
ncbi:MAG TPA: FAD-binding and (Fe-S)-binding domain-containing protein [Humisphaera sp.]|jgi:FAD/FMN-containing dehydrogenase/Fe-S oxidoreductase|nr:FAD-binding and (Fe-S)-binding domain-containing protein [Humisphaera sp.]